MKPGPHISGSAQNDIAHALEWSFENFGAAAEARYAALIAAAIAHAAQDPTPLDSRSEPSCPATSSAGTSPRASCTVQAAGCVNQGIS